MRHITAFVALAFARHYLGWGWWVWLIYAVAWILEEMASLADDGAKS